MDTTRFDQLLDALESADPAEAPDLADALAEVLEERLDEDEAGQAER